MWNEIKTFVSEQCPELPPMEFYTVVLGEFIDQTKCASEEDLLGLLYQEGVVSKQGIQNYKEDQQLEHIKRGESEGGGIGRAVLTSLLAGATAAAGTAGIYQVGKGLIKWRQKATRDDRLKKIKMFHPEVKDMDPRLVDAAMDDLEELNPVAAKSPLMAGSFIKDINLGRGTFDADKAKTISEIRSTIPDLAPSMTAGFNDTMKDTLGNTMSNSKFFKKRASEIKSAKEYFK